MSRRSDQGQAAPALASVFNRVTPGFWGQPSEIQYLCTVRVSARGGEPTFGSDQICAEAVLASGCVAGYSRLMSEDEEGTHERLKAHFAWLSRDCFTHLLGLYKRRGSQRN